MDSHFQQPRSPFIGEKHTHASYFFGGELTSYTVYGVVTPQIWRCKSPTVIDCLGCESFNDHLWLDLGDMFMKSFLTNLFSTNFGAMSI